MPTPSIPNFNGQIKTPWRWYNSPNLLSAYAKQCDGDLIACHFRMIWPDDSLPPFQFTRPTSMYPATSWKLYDGPGADANEMYDISDKLINVTYFAADGVDYVTYNGEIFGDGSMDNGTYWARIVSGGITYYSEPVTIVCRTYLENSLTVDPFASGLYSGANTGGAWSAQGPHVKILAGSVLVAGNPGPAYEVEGSYVANLGDDLLYEYSGGIWSTSSPADSTGWYNSETGAWLQMFLGSWAHFNDPVTVDENGICFNGTAQTPTSLTFQFAPQEFISPCSEATMKITLTVSGMTTGLLQVNFGPIGFSESIATITENGTTTFARYVNEDSYLQIYADDGFDGCLSGITIGCAATVNQCYNKLDWSNCGNVGNTYAAGGFVQSMFLDQAIYPVVPESNVVIESEQRPDGSKVEVSRRRETVWTLDMGLVPWYVADAMADVPMYDTIHMTGVGLSPDKLAEVRVAVDWPEDYGGCLADVKITFQVESATVSCCDDFNPPCRTSCVDAGGFDDETPLQDADYYLFRNQPRFAYYEDETFQPYVECASGLARIVRGDGAPYTVIFDVNTSTWSSVAELIAVVVTGDGNGGCTQTITATIAPGYVGILQYKNADDEWVDDDTQEFSAEDWLTNATQRVTPADEGAGHELRIRVFIDDCTIGYGSEFDYACE